MKSKAWIQLTRGRWPFTVPEIDTLSHRAAARMERIGQPSLVFLFAALLDRYALWTVDLPGSERSHHARPFGLLIHAIDTVEKTVAVGIAGSPGLPPEWIEATVAFALLHDCGRLLDLHVTDASGRVWNPLQESLQLFARGGTTSYRWKPGRGLDRHEYSSPDLFPLVLPAGHPDTLRRHVGDAWYAYVNRDRMAIDILGCYAFCAAGIVAWADQRSAQDDYFERKRAPRRDPTSTAHAPVCYDPPKAQTRRTSEFAR